MKRNPNCPLPPARARTRVNFSSLGVIRRVDGRDKRGHDAVGWGLANPDSEPPTTRRKAGH